MTKIIIEYADEKLKQETINDIDVIFEIWAMVEYFTIEDKFYGKIIQVNYEEKIIFTDICRITFISDNIKNEDKSPVNIDDENTVIFKPINKQSNGYIHLIEDAEYTVDFFDIDDNVIYLFGYNYISFSSSDFINKNTKLRITECDNSEEENQEYNETDFVIDDNVNIKFSKTISYIENEYSSLLNICDNNINLITEKRKLLHFKLS